jgi:sulfite exporter TauE/SafE
MGTWYYAFLIGLAGSWHCAIMCGPIYQQIHARGTATTRMGLYALGRIFMYSVLGFSVAGLGSIWLFPTWWQAYYVLAGILIALILKRKIGDQTSSFLHRYVGRFLHQIGAKLGPIGYFFLGMSNGLLPCGLVLGGLSIALIQPNPWMGAMSMVSFGMSTLPALRFSVWGIHWLGNGKPWMKWLGWIVVSILLFRGAYGIGVGHSAYLQHAKITPIICHPFSENLSP